MRIELLPAPAAEDDLRDLALLLLDAVDSGAGVSFMAGLTFDEAREFWRAHPATIQVVARDDEGIAGTVQLHRAWPPNQPHRADIAKLLVHRRARRQGLGAALMREIESRARAAGFTLLVLDTVRGDAAETLYREGGWVEVGIIPRYALNPDGSWCDTVVFYKELASPARSA